MRINSESTNSIIPALLIKQSCGRSEKIMIYLEHSRNGNIYSDGHC